MTYENASVRLDRFKLRLAKAVLEHHSVDEIRKVSLENLARWKARGTWCSAYAEWEKVMLVGSDEALSYLMTSEDEEPANRLRQSPPYVGLLSQEQVEKLRDSKEPKPQYKLADLLAQCDKNASLPDNMLAWENMPSVGKETE